MEHFKIPHPLIGRTAEFTIAVPWIAGERWGFYPGTLLGFECEQKPSQVRAVEVRQQHIEYFVSKTLLQRNPDRLYDTLNWMVAPTNLFANIRDETSGTIIKFRHRLWSELPWSGQRETRTCFLAWQRFDFGSQPCEEF